MNSVSRLGQVDTRQLPKDMTDLAAAIDGLPAEQRRTIDAAYQRVADSTRRRQRILALVQEALSQLRLDMKYLLFDLEATRRERDEYKDALEGRGD
jgi:hypothetical protein